eukprot:3656947-Prymnesium_polylepis.1
MLATCQHSVAPSRINMPCPHCAHQPLAPALAADTHAHHPQRPRRPSVVSPELTADASAAAPRGSCWTPAWVASRHGRRARAA